MYRDRVVAKGHLLIKASHPTTFELTKDWHLTARGDCIIGVNLDKAVADLDQDLKKALKSNTAVVIMVLRVDNVVDIVVAQGSEKLVLTDERKIVVRRSSYVDPATLAINANKSSKDLRRDLIEKLRNPEAILITDIYVLDLHELLSS